MTGIDFHVNAPDKVGYVCRLLRKAVGKGAKVVVTGEPALLRELDTALWTFSALEFIAHCHVNAAPTVLAASPVVLSEAADAAPHHEVLVNLGARVPDGFQAFERLIEIVTSGEEDLQHGRRRWKHYADRGYAPIKHDHTAKEAS